MVVLRRRVSHAPLGAVFTTHDALHSHFRVRLARSRRIVLDDHLLYPSMPWTGAGDRQRLDVVLRGELRCRDGSIERWLGPGDFFIGGAVDSLYTRMQGADALYLSIEWDARLLGTRMLGDSSSASLTARGLARLTETSLGIAEVADATTTIADVLAQLRAEGLPFDVLETADLVESTDPMLRRLGGAMGDALSRLSDNPASVDLELAFGASRRTVVRMVEAFLRRYRLNGTSWRPFRDRWRLVAAAALMSGVGARTEDVARSVGYGSPNAFCYAFAQAGLPSPGRIRAALHQLQ
jgi:AraC-like DNA-binding protein